MRINVEGEYTRYCVTANGVEIDSDWNTFPSLAAANEFFQLHMTKDKGTSYGFARINKVFYDIID